MKTYHMGRMSISDGVVLVVFLLIARLFTANVAEAVNGGAGLAWLNYLLSAAVALGVGLAMILAQNYFKGDFLTMAETLLGKSGFYLAGIFYSTIFLINGTLLLRQFSESTLQVGLKEVELAAVIAVYAVMAGISIYFGLEALTRTAYMLLPPIVIWMFFIYALLFPSYNIYNLLPWRGMGAGTVIYQALAGAGASVGVLIIVVLAPAFQNTRVKIKSIFWGSAIAAFLKVLFILIFLLSIGVEAGREKVHPFYELSSMAYLDIYFERLESFTVLLWVFVGIISVGVSMYAALYLVMRMLKLPSMRPLIPLVSVIIYYLANLPDSSMRAIELDFLMIKTYFNLGLYGFPLLLGAAFLFRKKNIFPANNKGG